MANPVTKLLQKNRFIRSLMSLDGNAKWVVLCEPFWAITSALYSAYAVQYRKEVIGLNNENLGFLLGTLVTISLVSQFVCSFVGGVIIDKYGRRRIYLISDLLSAGFSMLLLALAIAIARKTLRIVRQNIVFSLVIKIGCLLLTALGFTNMWWAIFADVGVMVLAVLNATRALKAPRI